MASTFTLEGIAEVLGRYHQRATYGAVADFLGEPARSIMGGRSKARQFCWIVNARNGLPTDYPPSAVDPALQEREHVIASGQELRGWLGNPT